jgi:small conductance mechanosensitive channel
MNWETLIDAFYIILEAIQNFIVTYLPKMIVAVIIVIVASYLAQKGGRLVDRALKRSKAEPGVTALLTNLTRWAILGTGIVVALGLFFNVTSLIAALGLVGFAVSFAFQDVLKNLVAGIIILVQHPFNVGESVSLDGFEGTVIAISTRSTEIQCFDGRLVLIPNGNSIGNPIINYSRSPQRRIELPMRLNYASDLETIRVTILGALKGVPGYLNDPEALVVFDTFGELSLGLTVYFWVDIIIARMSMLAKDSAFNLISHALSEKGIAMPVPVQSLVLQTGIEK